MCALLSSASLITSRRGSAPTDRTHARRLGAATSHGADRREAQPSTRLRFRSPQAREMPGRGRSPSFPRKPRSGWGARPPQDSSRTSSAATRRSRRPLGASEATARKQPRQRWGAYVQLESEGRWLRGLTPTGVRKRPTPTPRVALRRQISERRSLRARSGPPELRSAWRI